MIWAMMAVALFWRDADCRSCDLLANMAAALSEGNEISFISYLDKSTPDYQDISNNVGALLAQDEVAASLDVLSESGDDEKLEALVDWFVQITSRDGFNRVTRRRMRVKVTEKKIKGKWKITRMDPYSILDPVAIPQPR